MSLYFHIVKVLIYLSTATIRLNAWNSLL